MIVVSALVAGCAAFVTQPDFEWDPDHRSPGTMLTIEEVEHKVTTQGPHLEYHLMASGFEPGSTGELWIKHGSQFYRWAAHVRSDGRVVTFSGIDTHVATGFVPGQPFDVAFVSGDRRAQAKVFPDPIESTGTGGCQASVEVASEDGYLIIVSLLGFAPGEAIEIVSRFKGELVRQTATSRSDGTLTVPILYGHPDRGRASLTATAGARTVTIEYAVGEDALVVR
jgi:hypothetical protein